MKLTKKLLLIILSLGMLIACDLSTKKIAENELKYQQAKSYLGGSVKLVYAENSGGMLSLGDELDEGIKLVVFQVLVSLSLFALLIYTILKNDIIRYKLAALLLILAGGFGNLIDRVFNSGKVIDFIVFEIFGYHTGIFNIADFYITSGVAVLLLAALFVKEENNNPV